MDSFKTCCFTGHRPNRLPWGKDETQPLCVTCKKLLTDEVELAYQLGFRRFWSGMAMGGDLLFAEVVLACGELHPDVQLFAAIPCLDQTKGWSQDQTERYQRILERLPASQQILVQAERTRDCMLRRDRYMVNQSQRIIALYDGKSRGGTRYTLNYALKKGLESVVIDPYTLETIR